MKTILRKIGLTLAAVLTVTALSAPATQAQLTLSQNHVILHGVQKHAAPNDTHEFTWSGVGGIVCSTATQSGATNSTISHRLVMTPTYSGCKDTLGRTVHVTTNTLSYSFHSGATAGETKGHVDVSGELVMTITGSSHCTVTIRGPQTWKGISYVNLGGTNGIEVTTDTTNIHTTLHGGFFPCGTSSTTPTGSLIGKTIWTGKGTDGSPAVVSLD